MIPFANAGNHYRPIQGNAPPIFVNWSAAHVTGDETGRLPYVRSLPPDAFATTRRSPL